MKERGATGAGRHQIIGVPRVRRHLKRIHGRGTGNISHRGQTSGIRPLTHSGIRPLTHSGIRPLTPRAVIHVSMVTDGVK